MHQVLTQYKKTQTCNYRGHNFDSRKEGGEYRFFEKLKENGKIEDVQRQIRVDFYLSAQILDRKKSPDGKQHNLNPIISAKLRTGSIYRYEEQPHFLTKNIASYKIDLLVIHNGEILDEGLTEFIEVKGKQSMDWKKKWDLLEACFGNDDDYKLTIIK